jgi:hypothetical protein
MNIEICDRNGNFVSLETCIQEIQNTIITLQATIVQLEYQLKSQAPEEPKETPKSDLEKLKEEILEEVNLVISDLL